MLWLIYALGIFDVATVFFPLTLPSSFSSLNHYYMMIKTTVLEDSTENFHIF